MKPKIYKTVNNGIKEEYSFKNTLFYKESVKRKVYCRCCFSSIKPKKAYRLALWWDSDGIGHDEREKRRWYCNKCFSKIFT